MSSKAKRPTIATRLVTVKDLFTVSRAFEKKITELENRIRTLEMDYRKRHGTPLLDTAADLNLQASVQALAEEVDRQVMGE